MSSYIEQINKEKADTWPKILTYNYKKQGARRRAIRQKKYGIWQPYTWEDYYNNVKYLALGLLALGFKTNDKLLIIGDNAPEWYFAELAAQANHGISVGIYSDLTPGEIKYIAENSDAEFAIVEDQEQVDKILQIKDELPLLKKIIYWNYKGLSHYDNPLLLKYNRVIQSGKTFEKENDGLFEKNVESGKADDICALVYTAGTSGLAPKGVMHSYKTMRSGSEFYLQLDPWHENDNIIPYRPPAWMTEQWFGIGCHLLSASVLNFAESPETQERDIKETGPSIIFYGARQWESQAAIVHARILNSDAFKRFIFRKLMPVGYKVADLRNKKEKPNLLRKLLYFFADIILFRYIKKSLGLQNARICYSTEALLSPEAYRFYHALKLPLKSLYSTTEGGAITGAYNDDISFDSVGPVHKGIEIKITDNGELVCRQPGIFIGYYKDPEKTAEVLKDGWFYSGDCCSIKENGHIVFLDRMTDLIELANNYNLAPQFLESRLRFSPYITDAWVMAGPDKAYISAIIVINYNHVGKWAGQNRISFASFVELAQKADVYKLIEKEIEIINNTLPPEAQIKKYVNLHKRFDPDEFELTRTRKLRRSYLEKRYSDIINAIYSGKTEVQIDAQVSRKNDREEKTMTSLYIKSVNGSSI
jgi:long-chain acyl-CoA synthetase